MLDDPVECFDSMVRAHAHSATIDPSSNSAAAGSRTLHLNASIGSSAQHKGVILASRNLSISTALVLGCTLPAAQMAGAAYGGISCVGAGQSGFLAHPAVLDACLQLGAVIPRAADGLKNQSAFVPVGFEVPSPPMPSSIHSCDLGHYGALNLEGLATDV